jgi:hypothetical protein
VNSQNTTIEKYDFRLSRKINVLAAMILAAHPGTTGRSEKNQPLHNNQYIEGVGFIL